MYKIDYTILINKTNLLSPDFVPQDLIVTDNNENNFHNFVDSNQKPMISEYVYPFFLAMQKEAKKEGFNIIIDSGYRSYAYQKAVWDSFVIKKGLEEAKKLVAPPGASEHQSGLAFDIACFRDGKYSDDIKEEDSEVKWLFNNAYKFGFILRYPKGKESITGYAFEPWHFRFVGLELAKELTINNITLEEYYEREITQINTLKI